LLHVKMRADGLQIYASFPKLLLISLAATVPAVLYSCVRVFAWEFAFASSIGPALGALLPAGLCFGFFSLLWVRYKQEKLALE